MPAARLVGGGLAAAVRVAAGVLWLLEAATKYRAGFGAADIRLVVESATGNARVPGVYQGLAEALLGGAPGLFGFAVPLVELTLGAALVLGAATIPAAAVSIATLMLYWLAEQLTGQYPVMVLLSAVVLLFPAASTVFALDRPILSRLRTSGERRAVG